MKKNGENKEEKKEVDDTEDEITVCGICFLDNDVNTMEHTPCCRQSIHGKCVLQMFWTKKQIFESGSAINCPYCRKALCVIPDFVPLRCIQESIHGRYFGLVRKSYEEFYNLSFRKRHDLFNKAFSFTCSKVVKEKKK